MSKLPLLSLGAVVLGGVMFWLGVRTGAGRAPAPVVAPVVQATAPAFVATPAADLVPTFAPASMSEPAAEAVPALGPSTVEPSAPVETRTPPAEADVRRLENAVTTYATSGLPVVAGYLVDPHPELRRAAIEGMLQMGLAEAAPLLRDASGKVSDPRDAIAMLDAADFLELPTLELRKGKTRVQAPPPSPFPGREPRFGPPSKTSPSSTSGAR